jgi:hypothetical protein
MSHDAPIGNQPDGELVLSDFVAETFLHTRSSLISGTLIIVRMSAFKTWNLAPVRAMLDMRRYDSARNRL